MCFFQLPSVNLFTGRTLKRTEQHSRPMHHAGFMHMFVESEMGEIEI